MQTIQQHVLLIIIHVEYMVTWNIPSLFYFLEYLLPNSPYLDNIKSFFNDFQGIPPTRSLQLQGPYFIDGHQVWMVSETISR